MTVEAYPLQWPTGFPRTNAGERKRARFSRGETRTTLSGGQWRRQKELSVAAARERVEAELDRLGADRIVLSTNLHLRLDGMPRSIQRQPEDPGVAVYFTLDGVPHCLPCDRWDRVADNIAAIAKHIEATRGQLRWGVGDVKAAFAGFKALPGRGETTPAAGPDWRTVLGCEPFETELSKARAAYKNLALQHHPDRGGDASAMAMIYLPSAR
jgi:hypothetical protein